MAKRQKHSKRQHTVSRFYLKGFADDRGRLHRFDLGQQRAMPVSANDATVIKDFYTVSLPDGSPSDLFEQAWSEVEGPASAAVGSIESGGWPLAGEPRLALATWVALQHLRGSDHRSDQTRMRAEMIRLVVGISGKEALRRHIETAVGEPITDEALDHEWADLTKPGGPDLEDDVDWHLHTILELAGGTAAYLHDCHWTLIQFQRRALVTSDKPVSLLPAADHPPWSGVGIFTAGLFMVPLTRRLALNIQPRWQLESFTDRPEQVQDFRVPGTTKAADAINQATLAGASHVVFHHPADADALERVSRDRAPRPGNMEFPSVDHFIREEGLPMGSNKDVAAASRMHTPRRDDDTGVSLQDLPWPIPGRR